jgi:hypothetical protein
MGPSLVCPKERVSVVDSEPDPGSGIRCFFYPWIRDPRWVKNPDPGSGMNNPDHIFESLETIFGVKILKFFDDADPGWKKFGSGLNIPDPQHWKEGRYVT